MGLLPGINVIEQLSQDANLGVLKMVVALGTCAFLLWETRAQWAVSERTKQLVGLLLAVASLFCYFHLFQPPHRNYYHRWDAYHYFIGSKYAREIGYENLYACSVVAEADMNVPSPRPGRMIRNLHDDTLVPATSALADPSCKSRFTPERWRAYCQDVAWFRHVSGRGGPWWESMQQDHGYNPSPVWTVAGHALSSLAPAGDAFIKLLAAIDVALMALALALLGWGYGWRAAVVGAVFWGTQEPSSFYWMGGTFLRQDWLVLSIAAAALARKRHFFAAGAALGYAALLRVFPALFWAGPLLVIGSYAVRHRRLSPTHTRFLAGGLLSLALLVPASVAVAGVAAWPDFAHHITMHARTPISNHMSLKTLFAASPDTRLAHLYDARSADGARPWIEARRARLERLRPFYYAAAAGILALFMLTVLRMRSLWIALSLSPILVIVLTDPSCYYYSIFVLLVPLSRVHGPIEAALPGLAAVGQALAARFAVVDDKFAALAALYVGFAVVVLGSFMRCPRVLQRRWFGGDAD